MTFAKAIPIAGCGRERNAAWAIVDLREPTEIGKNPASGKNLACIETSVGRVELTVMVTGETIKDGKNPEQAEVIISCPATDCPFHTKS